MALANFAFHLILLFHLFTKSHHTEIIACLKILKSENEKKKCSCYYQSGNGFHFSLFSSHCVSLEIFRTFFFNPPVLHLNFNLRGLPLVFYRNVFHACKKKSAKPTLGKIIVLVGIQLELSSSVQLSSVAQHCLILYDPMNCSI